MRIDFTREERDAIEQARDAFHNAILHALKAHGVDIFTTVNDVTDVGESIALEGYAEF